MPPRYAYWTILVDDLPTAFRATHARTCSRPSSGSGKAPRRRDALVRARRSCGTRPRRAGGAREGPQATRPSGATRGGGPAASTATRARRYIDAKKARNVDGASSGSSGEQEDGGTKGPGDRPDRPRPDGPREWKDTPRRAQTGTAARVEGRTTRAQAGAAPRVEGTAAGSATRWARRVEGPAHARPNLNSGASGRTHHAGPKPEPRREWKERPAGTATRWAGRVEGPAPPRPNRNSGASGRTLRRTQARAAPRVESGPPVQRPDGPSGWKDRPPHRPKPPAGRPTGPGAGADRTRRQPSAGPGSGRPAAPSRPRGPRGPSADGRARRPVQAQAGPRRRARGTGRGVSSARCARFHRIRRAHIGRRVMHARPYEQLMTVDYEFAADPGVRRRRRPQAYLAHRRTTCSARASSKRSRWR